MDGVTLRPATADDFAFFFALHKESLGPYVDQVWGWEDDDQRAYLERNLVLSHARVIVVNGADVGRLDVEDHGDELFLALIEIAAEHRSRGIGGRVIQTLLNDAFAEGKRVRLSVLQVNTRAYQLYRRLGFAEVLREGVAPQTRIRMVAHAEGLAPAATGRSAAPTSVGDVIEPVTEVRMTEPHDASGQSLFAGTAWHYARYRPGYPNEFFDDIVQRFHLDGTGRLLDMGCGSGQLTIPLARHVTEAIGMDPEPEMLTEAAREAQSTHVTNVTWAQGSSTDLPGDLGQFRLVTMGRSFHWMDREQVLATLADMVQDDGGLVIANDGCLVRPTTAWQQAIEDVQRRFLPSTSRTSDTSIAETHEAILARSPFRRSRRLDYRFARTWTLEAIIGYLYSTSLPLRRLLGDRRPAFEQAITDTLLAIDRSGRFIEPVSLEVFIATRGSFLQ